MMNGTHKSIKSANRRVHAKRLIASLDKAELEAAWAERAIRGLDEVRSGKVMAVPAREVYRRIERLLAK
jgi:Putative addiction module component